MTNVICTTYQNIHTCSFRAENIKKMYQLINHWDLKVSEEIFKVSANQNQELSIAVMFSRNQNEMRNICRGPHKHH